MAAVKIAELIQVNAALADGILIYIDAFAAVAYQKTLKRKVLNVVRG